MSSADMTAAPMTDAEISSSVLALLEDNAEGSALLNGNIEMRNSILALLLSGKIDPKVVNAARALIADNDKSTLSQMKLEQDKATEHDRTALMKEFYMQLVSEHGRSFDMGTIIDGEVASVDPSKRELGSFDDEFVVQPHELIMGNDTEESVI